MKRVLDILIAGAAFVVLLPIVAVIVAAIYLDDRGPPFFKQKRVGRHGNVFSMLKFRSMVVNAERLGGYSTEPGDKRITRIGAFLRRTSLDELPQLLNVLKGDMSLVGPRPDVPAQCELYTDDEWAKRHRVRPGLTGLAQATLRSEATLEQRKALDLQYVDNPSIAMDFKIIAMTVRQLILRGSY